jgi:hypothetical protein
MMKKCTRSASGVLCSRRIIHRTKVITHTMKKRSVCVCVMYVHGNVYLFLLEKGYKSIIGRTKVPWLVKLVE